MTSERGDGTKFRAISDELRRAILAGEYGPGDRLPGENTLMVEHGVARETARKALDVLKHEGLAVARRGSGVFVTDFKPLRRHGIARLSRQQWGSGRSIWEADTENRTLEVADLLVYRAACPVHVTHVLSLDPDAEVWVRSRVFVLDGKPVMSATSYLPADLVDGSPITEADTGPGGTYARLGDLGYPPVHFREEIRARMPLPDEAERLKLSAGVPVIALYRTAYSADGKAVELNEMTLDAASYILEYAFDA